MEQARDGRVIELSVVIPLFNEEANVEPLLTELTNHLLGLHLSFEILCVNDGSRDLTADRVKAFRQQNPRASVRLLTFTRNRGQTAAFAAGFAQSRGRLVLTMDGDLQNDPANIAHLLAEAKSADLVIGVRKKRRDTLVRRLSSQIANAIRNWLTGDDIIDTGCSLKLFPGDLVRRLVLFEGLHRFLPTLCKIEGATVRQIPVNHRPRSGGDSKYNVWNRILVSFLDCLAVRWMKWRKIRYEFEPGSDTRP